MFGQRIWFNQSLQLTLTADTVPDGAALVLEFNHRKRKRRNAFKISTRCWTVIEKDALLREGKQILPLYRKPTNLWVVMKCLCSVFHWAFVVDSARNTKKMKIYTAHHRTCALVVSVSSKVAPSDGMLILPWPHFFLAVGYIQHLLDCYSRYSCAFHSYCTLPTCSYMYMYTLLSSLTVIF